MKICVLRYAAAIGALFFTLSCASIVNKENSYISRLKNRGIVPLSADNPYIAANVLLSKESENNPELSGFLQHRGYPNALRVTKEVLSPIFIEFFYLDKSEFYTVEEYSGTWLINGPHKMHEEKREQVHSLAIFEDSRLEMPVAPQHTPLDIENIVSLYGSEKAEISPKGDLIHYVSDPFESLLIIALWYTLDIENSERIARINHIKDASNLKTGQQIIIPGYMLKNKLLLNKEALTAIEEARAKNGLK